jgi:hypothetical protein
MPPNPITADGRVGLCLAPHQRPRSSAYIRTKNRLPRPFSLLPFLPPPRAPTRHHSPLVSRRSNRPSSDSLLPGYLQVLTILLVLFLHLKTPCSGLHLGSHHCRLPSAGEGSLLCFSWPVARPNGDLMSSTSSCS